MKLHCRASHFLALAIAVLFGSRLNGQAPEVPAPAAGEAPSRMIVIEDEPRSIDPVTVLPAQLVKKVDRDFDKTSLRELAQWAQAELGIPVVLDLQALAQLQLLSSEQITDRLQDEPAYLILDRLRVLNLGWYLDDGTLYITSLEEISLHYMTTQYVVSDLLDAGFDEPELLSTIEQETSGPWDADEPGTGTIVLLGDVLFVRQIDGVHREVAALLSGLRKHARQTILLDAPNHAALRAKLDQPVTLKFDETPLDDAVSQLGQAAGVDLRIDPSVLSTGIRARQPISLQIEGQKLRTAIHGLGASLEVSLSGMVKDGVLWIAPHERIQEEYVTAVFDVRDLCRDETEAMALADAIESQTGGPWDANEPGTGTLSFPIPGTMVCRQNPLQMDEVLKLLENYRTALRASKPRARADAEAEAQVVTTHYYRMPTEMADDLVKLIPELIAPDTWKGEAGAPGTIRKVASKADLERIPGPDGAAAGKVAIPSTMVSSPRSVLIIKQTKAAHIQIVELIRNIQVGQEPAPVPPKGGFQGGQQGGGFGGGFFQVKTKP